jgi:predicted DNA-binding protein YlxM (UPF0122 family)
MSEPGPAFDDDSHAIPSVDFDFDAIDPQPEKSPIPGWNEAKLAAVADGLNQIVAWLAATYQATRNGDTVRIVGRKAICLAFILRPEMFKERSMAELANKIGVSRQALHRFSREVWEIGNGRFQHGSLQHGHQKESNITKALRKRLNKDDEAPKLYDPLWPLVH